MSAYRRGAIGSSGTRSRLHGHTSHNSPKQHNHHHNHHYHHHHSPSTPPGILLHRLQALLSSLNESSKTIRKWSSDTDSHAATTNRLIESIYRIRQAVKDVEDRSVVRRPGGGGGADSEREIQFKQRLRNYQVPLDLIELMDYGHDASKDNGHNMFGLNPECFLRGMLREALRQLSGLKRRKVALEMLGKAIQTGIKKRDIEKEEQQLAVKGNNDGSDKKHAKRTRDETSLSSSDGEEGEIEAPPTKRQAT